MLIDDFTRDDGTASIGTRWTAFTDRVMGGVSDVHAMRGERDEPHLRMTGDVRLENNGGFVQVALPLSDDRRALDASAFRGLKLRVRGNGGTYYVHLRSNDTRAPWQYYAASFVASDEWTDVEIPWASFVPASLRTPLDPAQLTRVAIVAAKQRMSADVSVARIELVP